jgi:hypothetical protein
MNKYEFASTAYGYWTRIRCVEANSLEEAWATINGDCVTYRDDLESAECTDEGEMTPCLLP